MSQSNRMSNLIELLVPLLPEIENGQSPVLPDSLKKNFVKVLPTWRKLYESFFYF